MKTRYFLTVFLTLTATVVIFSGCAVRRVPLGHFGEPSKAPVFLISENAESGGRFAKEADGFSEYFRKLFQAKLINAGFRVVNDPNEKHHLEVKMKLFYDSDLNYKNSFQYEGNAAHAIEDLSGKNSNEKGVIKISTKLKGGMAEIRISDTGSGIPEDIKNRIFDPFFTTKEVGKGTGQGLAISHDIIINKHDGKIDVLSEPDKGTEFIISLPLE